MRLQDASDRQLREVYDAFTSSDDYAFDKTMVPVRLAQYGDEMLISRSQAKRLLARFERFSIVVLNFEGLDAIGQAFADEVFRVFPSEHPATKIEAIHTNRQIDEMISRARGPA